MIKEMRTVKFNEKKTDEITKEGDHGPDALGYFFLTKMRRRKPSTVDTNNRCPEQVKQMEIEDFLTKTLSPYSVDRIKIRAMIELQRLVDDRLIVVGDAYHLRDADGLRIGVVCEFKEAPNTLIKTN